MRRFCGEGRGVTGEHGGVHPEAELVIDSRERFQQPHAEKARATGDEERAALCFGPQGPRLREHVVKIFRGQRFATQEDWDARLETNSRMTCIS